MLRVRYFNAPEMYTQSQVLLMEEFIKLWVQHVYWTRFFLISTINELPDLDFVTNRLLRNPKDFAAVFKRYHGNEIANRFDELLTAHLTIAAQFVNQVKDGDTKAAMETRRLWYQNADDIATFLAEINPNNWTKAEWKKMMDEHLMLLERETTQLLNGNYSASIATFDEVENQAIMMANEMSKGIIKQFRL